MLALLVAAGCGESQTRRGDRQPQGAAKWIERPGEFTELPARPRAGASQAFWQRWGDGQAELAGYRARIQRYGATREAEVVLVSVVETMDRRSWIKDDAVPAEHRVYVMKLLRSEKFLTGVYPYSVQRCVYAPVEAFGPHRFAPVKLTLTAQEWCGHLFHGIWPAPRRLLSHRLSYFASEGQRTRVIDTGGPVLYEDALWIQLRELDGPFNGGKPWKGRLIPTLWRQRARHAEVRPVPATIERAPVEREGKPATRFTVRHGEVTLTIDVEPEGQRRILGWKGPGGEATLARSTRMKYWELNRPGDEALRERLGLKGRR